MQLETTSGKKPQPARIIISGKGGTGKTTLASYFTKPLFLDIEHGSCFLDVTRKMPNTYEEMIQEVKNLMADPKDYHTLVIDSGEVLEDRMAEYVCRMHGVLDFGDFNYGKGSFYVKGEWRKFLDLIDQLLAKTWMNVIFVFHTEVKSGTHKDPQTTTSYQKWEITANNGGDIVHNWCDFQLFLKKSTIIDKKNNHASGQLREIGTEETPWYDAKSRNNVLPAIINADNQLNAKKMIDVIEATGKKPEPTLAAIQNQESLPEPTEQQFMVQELRDRIHQSNVLEQDVIGVAVFKKWISDKTMPLSNFNIPTLKRIIDHWAAIADAIPLMKAKKLL